MTRSPYLAAGLSLLLPGAGQLYKGERAKGVAMLCISLGIWFWFAIATVGPAHARSWLSQVVLAMTYLFVLVPSVIEAFRGDAAAQRSLGTGERAWYVIVMILVTGAMAIPLLWQSSRFSRTAKVVWSVLASLNTLLALLVLVLVGPVIERWLNELSSSFMQLR